MDVRCRVVGMPEYHVPPKWPPTWPLPEVGQTVNLRGEGVVWVRGIDWYPEGMREGDTPHVVVVLGPKPRRLVVDSSI